MRTMVRITLPTEASNASIANGTLKTLIEQTMARLKPEAAYFSPTNGMRSAMFVFDLKDASDIPAISEPWFCAVNAGVEMVPCMNLDDLTAGLQKLASNR
jgi:hypothetical protein